MWESWPGRAAECYLHSPPQVDRKGRGDRVVQQTLSLHSDQAAPDPLEGLPKTTTRVNVITVYMHFKIHTQLLFVSLG